VNFPETLERLSKEVSANRSAVASTHAILDTHGVWAPMSGLSVGDRDSLVFLADVLSNRADPPKPIPVATMRVLMAAEPTFTVMYCVMKEHTAAFEELLNWWLFDGDVPDALLDVSPSLSYGTKYGVQTLCVSGRVIRHLDQDPDDPRRVVALFFMHTAPDDHYEHMLRNGRLNAHVTSSYAKANTSRGSVEKVAGMQHFTELT
jgi:hypothetical protein